MVLGELLKPEYTVVLAKNGAQTLERAARHAPDLILLDVMMPDMDGYEVLRRLRADPQTAHIAVIFISGLDRPEDEANGLKMGVADYIAKPFNATVVMARVALHLQVVRQRRMLERLAHIDGLTELANRRRFDEVYAAEWLRARAQQAAAVAGAARYRWLQAVQRPLRPPGRRPRVAGGGAHGRNGMRRPADLAARYGGEELVLLMPDTDAAQRPAGGAGDLRRDRAAEDRARGVDRGAGADGQRGRRDPDRARVGDGRRPCSKRRTPSCTRPSRPAATASWRWRAD